MAPYMARMLAILKHSNVNLHIVRTAEGETLTKHLQQVNKYNYYISQILYLSHSSKIFCMVEIICSCHINLLHDTLYVQVLSAEAHADMEPMYLALRQYVIKKDINSSRGGLKR
jgi:hypothetical protein